jgi:hypothetical protein
MHGRYTDKLASCSIDKLIVLQNDLLALDLGKKKLKIDKILVDKMTK